MIEYRLFFQRNWVDSFDGKNLKVFSIISMNWILKIHCFLETFLREISFKTTLILITVCQIFVVPVNVSAENKK